MTVAQVLVDESQRIATPVELHAAFQCGCQSRQSFKPSVEARFELRPRRNGHLYASYGAEGLPESSHDNLSTETIEQALMEFSPERSAG